MKANNDFHEETHADLILYYLMREEDLLYSWDISAPQEIYEGGGLIFRINTILYQECFVKITMNFQTAFYDIVLLDKHYTTIKEVSGLPDEYLPQVVDRMLKDESYPPKKQTKVKYDNYYFQYFFIPKLIEEEDYEMSILDNFWPFHMVWDLKKPKEIDIDWTNLSVIKKMSIYHKYFLIVFPPPTKAMELVYAMIMLCPNESPIYITLESTDKPDKFFLCKVSVGEYDDFGMVEMKLTLENFEKEALDLLKKISVSSGGNNQRK